MHVLFRCGVSRGKAEAQAVVGEQFAGIGVSDDYGVYQSLFTEHQLCWAHLLRKTIKLMLQHPEQTAYKPFLDSLYRIYQQAVRWQKDQRLKPQDVPTKLSSYNTVFANYVVRQVLPLTRRRWTLISRLLFGYKMN